MVTDYSDVKLETKDLILKKAEFEDCKDNARLKITYFLGCFEFGKFSYDYYFCTRNKKPYLCDTMLCSCGFEYSFIKLKVLLYYDY